MSATKSILGTLCRYRRNQFPHQNRLYCGSHEFKVSTYQQELAAKFSIVLEPAETINRARGMILEQCVDRLQLKWTEDSKRKEKPFYIDYSSSSYQLRKKFVDSELVCKAIGRNAVVVDLTAGLGRDSFLLASAGNTVIMVERNLILFGLLEDGIRRLHTTDPMTALRMKLFNIDCNFKSIEIIKDFVMNSFSDTVLGNRLVVYLDPMYPDGSIGKKASVKKEAQILRLLSNFNQVGNHENESNDEVLFNSAIMLNPSRIVVKRPINGVNLVSTSLPNSVIRGSTQRFDVYIP